MARLDEHDEMKDAPLLRSIPPHDPFVAPDGFFDRFPHMVQGRIVGSARRPEWQRSFARQAVRLAFGTAIVAGAAALVWSLWPAPPVEQIAGTPAPSAETDVLLLEDMDEELLLEAWDSGDAPALEEVDLPLNEEELLVYLENEDIPLDLLIEEL
jgi:hypothetical protein